MQMKYPHRRYKHVDLSEISGFSEIALGAAKAQEINYQVEKLEQDFEEVRVISIGTNGVFIEYVEYK